MMKFRILGWGGCFGRCGVALSVVSGVLVRGRQRGLGRYRREKARGQQCRGCVCRSRGAPESEKGETGSSLNLQDKPALTTPRHWPCAARLGLLPLELCEDAFLLFFPVICAHSLQQHQTRVCRASQTRVRDPVFLLLDVCSFAFSCFSLQRVRPWCVCGKGGSVSYTLRVNGPRCQHRAFVGSFPSNTWTHVAFPCLQGLSRVLCSSRCSVSVSVAKSS